MISTLTRIILLSAIILLTNNVSFAGNEVMISGQIKFTCDMTEKIMEKDFGHKYIKPVPSGQYITNLFAASGVEVVIKNSKNEIVGLVNTNNDGTFKISVDTSNFYTLDIEFLHRKFTKTLSKDSVSFIEIDFGRVPINVFLQ